MADQVQLAKIALERALDRLNKVCEPPYQWPPEKGQPNEGEGSEADRRTQVASNTTGEFSHALFNRALERVREAGDELGKAVAKKPPGHVLDR
jgi:hypothetical protein